MNNSPIINSVQCYFLLTTLVQNPIVTSSNSSCLSTEPNNTEMVEYDYKYIYHGIPLILGQRRWDLGG